MWCKEEIIEMCDREEQWSSGYYNHCGNQVSNVGIPERPKAEKMSTENSNNYINIYYKWKNYFTLPREQGSEKVYKENQDHRVGKKAKWQAPS